MAGKTLYPIKQDLFDTWTPESAYAFGWVITDGSMAKESPSGYIVEFELKEYDDIYTVANLFGLVDNIKVSHKKQGDYWRVRVSNKVIYRRLQELGITPNKTFDTHVPSSLPPELFSHFMRGVVDGDGCIGFRENYVSKITGKVCWRLEVTISSGCPDFLKEIQEYLGYGAIGEVGKEGDGHHGWRLYFDCSVAVKFLDFIYKDSKEGLRLPRKWQKWQAFNDLGYSYRI